MPIDREALREEVALACRILGRQRIMREVTGHVSARLPGGDEMLVRCRGRQDPGVAETSPKDIRRASLDGEGEELDGYWLPGEFPIHAEIYRLRPDVGAVVHGHPRSSLLCGILGLELRRIFGAYDPVSTFCGGDGHRVFPRSILISSRELGVELVETMEGRDCCLLRGHGIVTVGRTLEEATVRAIKLETLAEVTLQAAQAGGRPPDLPPEELASLEASTARHGEVMPVMLWTWDLYARALEKGTDPS